MTDSAKAHGADWNASIGAAVRRLRLATGLTQAAFSERVDLGQGDLSKIEAGTRGLSIDSMARIAQGLGVATSELIRHAEALQEADESAVAAEADTELLLRAVRLVAPGLPADAWRQISAAMRRTARDERPALATALLRLARSRPTAPESNE